MRPCVTKELVIRNAAFGGPKPLFCIPLVAKDRSSLLAQAQAAKPLDPDVIEWRSDSWDDLDGVVDAARELRRVFERTPILFTLRDASEGGAKPLAPEVRAQCIGDVVRSGQVDLVDIELSCGPQFVAPLVELAHAGNVRVILSFHDFQSTPDNDTLLSKIAAMIAQRADIAKIACMPREASDVLRLLQVTRVARATHPAVPLCTISMGSLGSWSRVVAFLHGCDMTFAVGQEASAPGQIPIREARALTEGMLRYS